MSVGYREWSKIVVRVFTTRQFIEDITFAPGTPDWRVAERCITLDLDPADIFKILDDQLYFERRLS